MATRRWRITQTVASLEVSFIPEPAIPMAVYMAIARGGVIPAREPVRAGRTAAVIKGSMPIAAREAITAPPKIATIDEPGRIIPRKVKKIGRRRASWSLVIFKLSTYNLSVPPISISPKR